MRKVLAVSVLALLAAVCAVVLLAPGRSHGPLGMRTDEIFVAPTFVELIALPEPVQDGELSLEEALWARRSVRTYAPSSVSLAQLGQLLWAAQGVTHPRGLRTAPSAGALYPLELYAVVERVEGLAPGLYRYAPGKHGLQLVRQGSFGSALADASLGQSWVREAAVNLVFAAAFERTTGHYGHRGRQYVYIEVGHAAQNVYLQAPALGLGTVAVGAFDDGEVRQLLGLEAGQEPVYIMSVGRLRDGR